ncbi:MAG: DegT/DnrJ/EryC1/StrS family aminotransferase [Planctomycetes bacterium]|nr:DegT/DnrJ/EryC1/StrS family aminotransferase [Planctomycetota bacterium]
MDAYSRTRTGALARVVRRQARRLSRLLAGLPLSPPEFTGATLGPADVARARRLLAAPAGWSDPAPVQAFEREFARWNGSRHACAFATGREALTACLLALGLGPGDELILPGYTCVAVVNALSRAGVAPVFCDIELETYGADAADAERRITPRTRGFLLQHLYGLVSRDAAALCALAARRGLLVIEECAHATGARWAGARVGNRGVAAIYSSEFSKAFYSVQGGVATTNDDAVAARLAARAASAPLPAAGDIARQLHTVALDYYQFQHPRRGWLGDWMDLRRGAERWESPPLVREPCATALDAPERSGVRRMPAPIAELAAGQLAVLDAWNARRRRGALRWDAWCRAAGYAPPRVVADSEPTFLRYPVLVEPARKADRRWALAELGVRAGDWFRTPLHPVPHRLPDCPNAEAAAARCVNLPTLGVGEAP